MSPLQLKTSKKMRLARLYKGAVYKDDAAQLQLPLRSAADSAVVLVEALRDLVPVDDA
jgi:hypothetical protein